MSHTAGQTPKTSVLSSPLLSFFYLGGDVLISSLANLVFLSYAFQVHPHPVAVLCLGLTVFCIYLFDRSVDSWKEKEGEVTQRGSFYKNKLGILFLIGLLAFAFDILLILYFLPFSFFLGGIFLGFFVLLYFLTTQYFRTKYFPKEVFLSGLYCLGVAYPILFDHTPGSLEDLLIYFLFFISILSNVLLTYRFDMAWDEAHHLPTIARSLGKEKTTILFYLLMFLGFFLCGVYVWETGKVPLPLVCLIYSFCYLMFMEWLGRKKEIPTFKIFCELVYSPFLLLLFL